LDPSEIISNVKIQKIASNERAVNRILLDKTARIEKKIIINFPKSLI